MHLAGRSGLVTAPEASAEWGVTAVVLGFVLLVGSVGASLALRHTRDAAKERGEGGRSAIASSDGGTFFERFIGTPCPSTPSALHFISHG